MFCRYVCQQVVTTGEEDDNWHICLFGIAVSTAIPPNLMS